MIVMTHKIEQPKQNDLSVLYNTNNTIIQSDISNKDNEKNKNKIKSHVPNKTIDKVEDVFLKPSESEIIDNSIENAKLSEKLKSKNEERMKLEKAKNVLRAKDIAKEKAKKEKELKEKKFKEQAEKKKKEEIKKKAEEEAKIKAQQEAQDRIKEIAELQAQQEAQERIEQENLSRQEFQDKMKANNTKNDNTQNNSVNKANIKTVNNEDTDKQTKSLKDIPNIKKNILDLKNVKCKKIRVELTGFADKQTATGVKPHIGTIAVPPEIPYGTKIYIPGYGICTAEDIGGAIKIKENGVYKIDIWQPTEEKAWDVGLVQSEAYILEN